ncbi:hypothetical protein HMPREF1508_1335 [Shuttleworthella sp. MSX8B]|nr:hypothetical protein HMPREF1508_1335 [Shuttleworthia sp. MSX8B]
MAGRQRADGILIEREVLTGREAERKVIPEDRGIHAGRWEGR